MKRFTAFFALCAILLSITACKEKNYTEIINLRTDFMVEPLGIDNPNPQFSWEMNSNRYGAKQVSYRLMVYSEDNEEMFDSGVVASGNSVGIVYRGAPLQPSSMYTWGLSVTDENGVQYEAMSHFETGLMSSTDRSVWEGAQWIGSARPHFSKYRSIYDIDYDVRAVDENGHATFVFGYRDDENYVCADLDVSSIPASFVLSHVTEGVAVEDDRIDLYLFGKSRFNRNHHIKLHVVAGDYALNYGVNVFVDGFNINPEPVVIRPYPLGAWMPYCRLYSIGYMQPDSLSAEFSNVAISEHVWGTQLYSKSDTTLVKGGEQVIWTPAEETGVPMLRKNIRLKSKIASARLYTTARGIYECSINGEMVSGEKFNPGSTDYRYSILYSTFDVTNLLHEGNNALCAQIGSGWWCDFTGFATAWQDLFGNELSFLCKLVVKYENGKSATFVSDSSWKVCDDGPVLSDSFQNGEDYDARAEVLLWNTEDFDDASWDPVKVFAPVDTSVEIRGYIGDGVENNIILTAKSVSEPVPGVFVYDMGQNMVGVPRIRLIGEAGTKVTFKYGEMAFPDVIPEDPVPPMTREIYEKNKGRAYNENYRGALSTDNYIMKGKPEGETFEPHWTFHGYRYIEIHGLAQALPLENVQGIVLESIGNQTSSYESSNPLVNRLFDNIVWGQRGNFLSIPTDCPQRDERLGWMGDANVFARAATYNMNVDPFYHRFMQTVRDVQGADGAYTDFAPYVPLQPIHAANGKGAVGWQEAGVVIPWQCWQQYGDLQFVRESYPSMRRFMEFMINRAIDNIQPGSGYGDWCAIEHTNSPLTNTCWYGYDALLMSKMAAAIGESEDAKRYAALYEEIKTAFNREFVDENGVTKESVNVPPYQEWIAGSADDKFVANTQTSYVLPLQAGLFNEKNKPLAIKHLVEDIAKHGYTLTTGFIGTPYIALVLSENGEDETAYKLFEQTEYASWLYPVVQGATTIWERWNSYTLKNGFGDVGMNSFNHYSYGAIEEWMMVHNLGIQRDEENPAYKHIILQPKVGGQMTYAKGGFHSVYGDIKAGWEKKSGGYVYTVTIPANTTATLNLNLEPGQRVRFKKGGQHATKPASSDPDVAVYELVSGTYEIRVK